MPVQLSKWPQYVKEMHFKFQISCLGQRYSEDVISRNVFSLNNQAFGRINWLNLTQLNNINSLRIGIHVEIVKIINIDNIEHLKRYNVTEVSNMLHEAWQNDTGIRMQCNIY